MAAVLGLSRLLYVERRLLEVSDPTLPVGRFFEPLWVKRRKHTRDPVDDFYFNDRGYGRDWRFAWDEEDEAPAPGAEGPVPAKEAVAACG